MKDEEKKANRNKRGKRIITIVRGAHTEPFIILTIFVSFATVFVSLLSFLFFSFRFVCCIVHHMRWRDWNDFPHRWWSLSLSVCIRTDGHRRICGSAHAYRAPACWPSSTIVRRCSSPRPIKYTEQCALFLKRFERTTPTTHQAHTEQRHRLRHNDSSKILLIAL